MTTIAVPTSGLEKLTTQAKIYTQLRALAAALRLPRYRHHLVDTHPGGTPFSFEAGFEFVTADDRVRVHVRFSGGRVRVGLGPLPGADVTARFRDARAMRAFFGGGDLFGMLLSNEVSFSGNLSYLSKFGFMTADVQRLGRPRRRAPELPPDPARWQDLPVPRAGEPLRTRPPLEEARFLEDPSFSRYTLDDFPRVKRLLWAFRTTMPEVCTERAELLTEVELAERAHGADDPPVLRQARKLAHVLAHKRPIIHDDDLLAGTTTSKRVGVVIYPELGGTGLWPELLTLETRALNPYRLSDDALVALDRHVFPFWMDDNVREWTRRANDRPRELELDERFVLYFMWKTQAVSHTIADMPAMLSRGLVDIADEARRHEREAAEERKPFYRALAIALDAVVGYARHLSEHALALAASLPGGEEAEPRRAELRELARICAKVPAHPAETLAEAVQAVWIVFLCMHQESMNAGLSVGRLDVWLQPFFERDLETTPPAERPARIERALELVSAFMLKLTDHLPMVPDIGNRLFGGSSSDQVITLGGLTRDGRSAVCDMTWILLKATEMLRLRDPNMNARHAPGVTSEAYLERLCEVNVLTHATPSLHNDHAVFTALRAQGFAEPDARDWGATGCVEPTSCGRHYGHTNCMMLNLVAPLEMALADGVHPLIGTQVGPRTGDPARFASYDELYAAYTAQLRWLIDMSVSANDMLGRAHQAVKPTPFLSALIDGPMRSGRDVIDGGARYNSSGAAMVGLTDVVDSLAAMKVLVFDRRELPLETLLRALAADFVGFEDVHAMLERKAPKYGQDDPLPRSIADGIVDFVFARFQGHVNYRGGRYVPGYWSMSNHVAFGILSGALPSGRRRGKAFTPGLTPAPSAAAPLTSQIRTVAGLAPEKLPNNIAFNCKVVPGAEDAHSELVGRMAAYVGSYFELGGMQMQFNVTSTATLRDAMEHPEQYRDLLVRISGYNAYFVELNRDMQVELIERMEHTV